MRKRLMISGVAASMRALALALTLAAAACASDPCAGRSGTCIALTVNSPTLSSLDQLHIVDDRLGTAKDSSPGRAMSLPISLAVTLPAGAAGHVVRSRRAAVVAASDAFASTRSMPRSTPTPMR